jgi:hypothetical protein
MKTLSHTILIGLSLGCLNLALAEEHFNDRSQGPATLAAGEPTSIHPEDRLSPQRHFNDDNEWVYEVPGQGAVQCATDSAFGVASSSSFNDKYSNRC